jgi:hypothetical protein
MADFDSRMAGSILTADIPPDSVPLGAAGGEQDSVTVAYVLAVRPAFEMLKHAAAQLAAFLILATTGSQATGPDHALLAEARRAVQEAMDGVGTAPGVTDLAARHCHINRKWSRLSEELGPKGDHAAFRAHVSSCQTWKAKARIIR